MDTVILTSSFALIFLAEMGDKSQLIAMSLAGRYRVLPVAVGVMSAFLLLNLLAVAVGQALFQWIPQQLVLLLAAGLFLFFAYGAWRESAAEDAAETGTLGANRSALIMSFLLIFVAELGDKTQLAMVGLTAGTGAPLSVLVGGTLALWSVSLLGIWLGGTLLRRLSPMWMHRASAVLFLGFGLWALLQLSLGEDELTALVPSGMLPQLAIQSSGDGPCADDPAGDCGQADLTQATAASANAPPAPSPASERSQPPDTPTYGIRPAHAFASAGPTEDGTAPFAPTHRPAATAAPTQSATGSASPAAAFGDRPTDRGQPAQAEYRYRPLRSAEDTERDSGTSTRPRGQQFARRGAAPVPWPRYAPVPPSLGPAYAPTPLPMPPWASAIGPPAPMPPLPPIAPIMRF